MTYYEELGVSATASREEIRQAYKHLARLIHPDQCGDEASRRLADLQMKRLNGMLEVLQDDAGRHSYDRSLAALALAVSGEPVRPAPYMCGARWTVRAAVAAGAVVLILLLLLTPARQSTATPAMPQIAGATAPGATRAEHHHNTASKRARPVAAEPEWEPLATYTYESHVPIPPLPFPEAPVSHEPIPAADNATPARAASSLTGDWLFVPAASVDNIGYPPEYIELRLREEDGLLRGRYQARYRVADRAISPNVAFRFEGPMAAEGGTIRWNGASGAKGQLTLRLLPDGDLEVNWEAEELGRELGLISGRATLVRKME